jgi:hypothetical protein
MVEDELKTNFVAVQLYTDGTPAGAVQVPDAAGARAFRDEKLGNYALPYYVILKPLGGNKLKRIAYYDKPTISSPEEFLAFLRKAQAAAKKG